MFFCVLKIVFNFVIRYSSLGVSVPKIRILSSSDFFILKYKFIEKGEKYE